MGKGVATGVLPALLHEIAVRNHVRNLALEVLLIPRLVGEPDTEGIDINGDVGVVRQDDRPGAGELPGMSGWPRTRGGHIMEAIAYSLYRTPGLLVSKCLE